LHDKFLTVHYGKGGTVLERLNKSEKIFRIVSYVLLGIFAVVALYPVVYAFSASISSKAAYEAGQVVLFPVEINFDVYELLYYDKGFWITYINTLFYAVFGTAAQMILTIIGAYALSKRRLLFKRQFNFFVVFTLWFTAGMIPQYLNFVELGVTNKYGIIYGFAAAAFNVVLLRNAFESVPDSIEEAAIVDGANDFGILTRVYIPMNKSALATVALFYGIGRWNGYIWQRLLLKDVNHQNLQVYMQRLIANYQIMYETAVEELPYAADSYVYAIMMASIIPILFIYPHIQQFFVKGVNLGGVKE